MFIYCICTQYLVGAPFALITASIRRGMEVISLWHCWGGMEAQVSLTVAFSASAYFGLLFLIFLLTIPHIFSMGFRSGEFAGQSSTSTPWSFNQISILTLLAVVMVFYRVFIDIFFFIPQCFLCTLKPITVSLLIIDANSALLLSSLHSWCLKQCRMTK